MAGMRRGSATFPSVVALAGSIDAVAGLGELPIGTDAGLGIHAPEQTIIAGRHSGVALVVNEKPLPTKPGTQVRMACIEA